MANASAQPRTLAHSRDDVLSNLTFFFGAPASPEKLKDYNEHHAATLAFPDAFSGPNSKLRDTLKNLLLYSVQQWQTSVALPYFQIEGTVVECAPPIAAFSVHCFFCIGLIPARSCSQVGRSRLWRASAAARAGAHRTLHFPLASTAVFFSWEKELTFFCYSRLAVRRRQPAPNVDSQKASRSHCAARNCAHARERFLRNGGRPPALCGPLSALARYPTAALTTAPACPRARHAAGPAHEHQVRRPGDQQL